MRRKDLIISYLSFILTAMVLTPTMAKNIYKLFTSTPMTTFKTSNKSIGLNFIWANILILLFLVMKSSLKESDFLLIVILNIIVAIYSFKSVIIKISIQDNIIEIVKLEYFRKIIERFDIQTLNYTYNIEMAGRGIKHKVLRIFCNNSQVAVFRPTFSGWDEEIIIQIEKTISTKVVRPLSN